MYVCTSCRFRWNCYESVVPPISRHSVWLLDVHVWPYEESLLLSLLLSRWTSSNHFDREWSREDRILLSVCRSVCKSMRHIAGINFFFLTANTVIRGCSLHSVAITESRLRTVISSGSREIARDLKGRGATHLVVKTYFELSVRLYGV